MNSKAICLLVFFLSFNFLIAQHGGYRYVGLDNTPEMVHSSSANSEVRIPYSSKGLWGFLDENGNVIIEAQYPKVQNFSEDLAAVRTPEGLYGYISINGEMKIEAAYDDAYPFFQDVAVGFTNKHPILIHKNGEAYELPKYVVHINRAGFPRHFIVETKNGNQGIVDSKGKFLVDTIYSSISSFNEGYALVRSKKKKNTESGIINQNGEVVIPLGKYKISQSYSNGTFLAEVTPADTTAWNNNKALISLEGDTLFMDQKDYELKYQHEKKYDEGLYIVSVSRPENFLDKDHPDYDRWSKDLGLVNSEGELLWKEDEWQNITGFYNNRAFVQEKDSRRWFLINENGERINKRGFIGINASRFGNDYELFEEGYEQVLTDEGWTLIDKHSKVVAGPLFRKVDQSLWLGTFLAYSVENEDETHQYGFWDAERNKDTGPQYDDVSWIDEDTQTFLVKKDGNILVENTDGKRFWSQPEDQSFGPLNVDFMVRGYFYASSPQKQKYAGYGGWGGSSNEYSKANSPSKKQRELTVIVEESADTVFAGMYKGHKVRVVNLQKDTVVFEAQDSRLYMNVQAKDQDGKWRDIEYLPSSWCGNSYHQLYLPPDTQWQFTTPQYKGGFDTDLRIQLICKGKGKTEKKVYSNIYKGSVNPGQFWQKPGYVPGGIMDPYNE